MTYWQPQFEQLQAPYLGQAEPCPKYSRKSFRTNVSMNCHIRPSARRSLKSLEQDEREAIYKDPEKIDLIEEGAFQAARSTTVERIKAVAELVANGLEHAERNLIRRKRLLRLLGEIDDDQLVLFNAYGQSYGGDGKEAWDKVDRPDPPHMQSSREELDRDELFQLGEFSKICFDLAFCGAITGM